MSEIEHDSSDKSNSSFQVGADILNLLFLYIDLFFSRYIKCLNQLMPYFY